MTNTGIQRDDMIELAKEYQQNYYELLADWYPYRKEEYPYLRQNIGFAIFGPPQRSDNNAVPIVCYDAIRRNSVNVINDIIYTDEARNIITAIYNKILEYGNKYTENVIYFGVIYNVIILHNNTSTKSRLHGNRCSENMLVLPIFKVRTVKNDLAVWYIDREARTYKSWADYKASNRLPECTMVLPKHGSYQSDPGCLVTEEYSTVWLEVLMSPACKVSKTVLKVLDITSNVAGIGAAVGLGVASFLTPIGPVLTAAGLVTSGISGVWTIGRCSEQLVDRKKHDESISVADKTVLPIWLGIAGSALGVGATGGAAILTKAVERGASVGAVARIAYNSLIIGNLTVNGIGVAYQSFCMIEKYREEHTVDMLDVLMFSTHVLFFSNSVLNTKLAGQVIGTSQGTILERFENYLRGSRFRDEYARITRLGNMNVKNDYDNSLIRMVSTIQNSGDLISTLGKNIHFINGRFNVNNISLIDPLILVSYLLTASTITYAFIELGSKLILRTSNVLSKLSNFLCELLKECYSKLPNVEDFNGILSEMVCLNNPHDVLLKVLTVAGIIIRHRNQPELLVVDATRFIWEYCKANLKDHVNKGCSNEVLRDRLINIITAVFDVGEVIESELCSAFNRYIHTRRALNRPCNS